MILLKCMVRIERGKKNVIKDRYQTINSGELMCCTKIFLKTKLYIYSFLFLENISFASTNTNDEKQRIFSE